eukprot:m.231706 g.231706  ORF g.231706 m.231706 type:complete len:588 (-) comp12256_c0_seq1:462-2225(-)
MNTFERLRCAITAFAPTTRLRDALAGAPNMSFLDAVECALQSPGGLFSAGHQANIRIKAHEIWARPTERDRNLESAIMMYTSETALYQVVNRSLRALDPAHPVPAQLLPYIKLLQNALAAPSPHFVWPDPGTRLYRGLNFDFRTVAPHALYVGDVIEFQEFLSFSCNSLVAEGFAHDGVGDVNTLFTIVTHQTSTGRLIGRVAHPTVQREEEVVHPAGTCWRIMSMDEHQPIMACRCGASGAVLVCPGCGTNRRIRQLRITLTEVPNPALDGLDNLPSSSLPITTATPPSQPPPAPIKPITIPQPRTPELPSSPKPVQQGFHKVEEHRVYFQKHAAFSGKRVTVIDPVTVQTAEGTGADSAAALRRAESSLHDKVDHIHTQMNNDNYAAYKDKVKIIEELHAAEVQRVNEANEASHLQYMQETAAHEATMAKLEDESSLNSQVKNAAKTGCAIGATVSALRAVYNVTGGDLKNAPLIDKACFVAQQTCHGAVTGALGGAVVAGLAACGLHAVLGGAIVGCALEAATKMWDGKFTLADAVRSGVSGLAAGVAGMLVGSALTGSALALPMALGASFLTGALTRVLARKV